MFKEFLIVVFHFEHRAVGRDEAGFALRFVHRVDLMFKEFYVELLF